MKRSVFLIPFIILLSGIMSCTQDDPPTTPARPPDDVQAKSQHMSRVGFLVGNFNVGPEDAILRYDGDGNFIDAVIPAGTAGLEATCCMAYGPDENLYVADPFGGNVLRFHGITGEFIDTFIPPGSGGLMMPLVMVFHDEHLYVGDIGAQAIRRYDRDSGDFIDDFVPAGSQGMLPGDPQHFGFGPDGNLYVGAEGSHRILRYDGQTGEFLGEFPHADYGWESPSGLVFGPDGLLYVGSNTLNEVRRFDIWTDSLVDIFVPTGSGGLAQPVGIAFGPDGHFYAASVGSHQILRYNGVSGEFMDVFIDAGVGGLTGPRVIQFKSKITLAHRPPGRPDRCKTLTVDYMSAFGHVGHGDALGPCE